MFTQTQSVLIDHVARNLWSRLGARALPLADAAVARMYRAADDDGLDLWLAIHERLVDAAGPWAGIDAITVH